MTQNFIAKLICKLGADKEVNTAAALTNAYKQAETRDLDLSCDKWILFSDHHRGAKNGADDFRTCENTYCAALAYYLAEGYSLCTLGDAEELWEEHPKRVLSSNEVSFAAERQFHEAGRYARLWGNHDEIWSEIAQPLLQPQYGLRALEVREALKFNVLRDGQKLGEILLVHGHQGTQNAIDQTNRTKSKRVIAVSKFFLRTFWRPLQQITGFSCNTPAGNWEMRAERDKLMQRWAAERERLVLIAGHTHAPVFTSYPHPHRVLRDMTQVQGELASLTENQNEERDHARRRLAGLSAELQKLEDKMNPRELEAWLEQKARWQETAPPVPKPSYFNTGCCSFADGKITGIEIAAGEMRLVRFPNDAKENLPKVLQSKPLEDIFAQLGAPA